MKSVGKWLCLIGIAALLFAIAGCGGKAKEDTEAPVITLSAEVPKSGYNGKTVVLPTATASDNVDGDLTESVKVTVNAYDESGDVKAEPVYNKPANVERTFVPAARYAGYKIIYFVSDAAGNEASLVTEFSAIDDTAPPVLTVNAASNEGITVAADEYFKLPTATGIDKPMDDDITDDIQIMIMDSSNAVVSTFKGGATEHTGRIVEGNYTIVYTLSDGAGNEAESVTLPLIVTAADYSKNLLKAENIVKGNSASFNDYGWLSVGMNSASGTAFDTSCAAFNLVHIKDEYVGVKFNIDTPSEDNPEFMYQIGAVGYQRTNAYAPNADYPWQEYMFIRFIAGGVTIYSNSTSSAGNSATIGKNYFDGQDHTLYFRYEFNEGGESEAASVTLKLWLDCTPVSSPSLSFTLKCSETETSDKAARTLAKTEFENLFASKGWLNFMSYTTNGNTVTCGDDKMTVKAIFIYLDGETFEEDKLSGPSYVLSSDIDSKYVVDTEVTLPVATWNGALSDKTERILYGPDGEKIDVADDAETYTFTQTGNYRLIFAGCDELGVYTYKELTFKIILDDKTAPVISVDETALTATIGQAFSVPEASAEDETDGDITADIKIVIDGVSYVKDVVNGGLVTLNAPGKHFVVYTVTDAAGNVSEKSVEVNVAKTSETLGTGNILASEPDKITGNISSETNYLTIPSGQSTVSYNGYYIYDQKVSMVVYASECSEGIFLVNMRGVSVGTEWLNGLVLSLRNGDGSVAVSYGSWTGNTFGYANKNYNKIGFEKDVLLEFKVSDVQVDGVDYVLVQVWLNHEELVFNADASKGGVVGTEGGIMVARGAIGNAAYAGNFAISVPSTEYPFTGVIKELRIDGSDIDFTLSDSETTENDNQSDAVVKTASAQPLLTVSCNELPSSAKECCDTYGDTRLDEVGTASAEQSSPARETVGSMQEKRLS